MGLLVEAVRGALGALCAPCTEADMTQPHFERTACEKPDSQSLYYFYRKLPQINVNSVIPYMCVGATMCVIHVEARGQLSTSVSLFLFLETNSLTGDPEFNC